MCPLSWMRSHTEESEECYNESGPRESQKKDAGVFLPLKEKLSFKYLLRSESTKSIARDLKEVEVV